MVTRRIIEKMVSPAESDTEDCRETPGLRPLQQRQSRKLELLPQLAAPQGARGAPRGLGVHAKARAGQGSLDIGVEISPLLFGQRLVKLLRQLPVQPRQ